MVRAGEDLVGASEEMRAMFDVILHTKRQQPPEYSQSVIVLFVTRNVVVRCNASVLQRRLRCFRTSWSVLQEDFLCPDRMGIFRSSEAHRQNLD